MASFVERCIRKDDWQEDGGHVDLDALQTGLVLYEAGKVDAAWLKTLFSCTGPQATQLDAILGTMPANVVVATVELSPPERHRWAALIAEVMRAGLAELADFTTEAACKAAIGIS